MKRKRAMLAILTLGLILLASCGPKVEWDLVIDGSVDKPKTLSYADLSGMKKTKLENILMAKSQGEDEITSWEGPTLDDVFGTVGVQDSATGVTVVADDGYAIQMTMDDLQGGIIALSRDGKSIADDEKGPIRIVIPGKPSNFWVFQVVQITFEETPIAAPTPKPEPVALTVSGAVENELALSLADLEAMPVIKISAEFKGETAEHEGVTLKDILDRAGVSSGASSLTLTAADDYSKDVDYADVQACAECIVAFDRDAGYLRMVMPGLSTGAWIKDVVRIEVK
ncbi:MAG TPA: molybdopterin-dependent oxidoreductase [Anaerolineae bacterium]|nr:molybdopterin-dependent oxidoreductase [Anaerolineae bacterium]